MPDRTFALSLAKLAIAAAWADGHVHLAELNAVKALLLELPDVTEADWRELELYLDHPIDEAELELLLGNVMDWMATPADRALVLDTLEALVEADGIVTVEEAEMLGEVRLALDGQGPALGAVGTFVGGMARRWTGKVPRVVREDRLGDFVHNPIFFRVCTRTGTSRDELRGACLAGGLLAIVAGTDREITKEERGAIRDHLATELSLADADAELIADVATRGGLERVDPYRLGQRATEQLSRAERRGLMRALWRVGALGGLGDPEEYLLRRISSCLGLTHKELMDARLATR